MIQKSLVNILEDLAFLAELQNENPFKVRALQNAAGILEEQSQSVEQLVATGEIAKIPGIGKGTQAIAREFAETGVVKEYEERKAALPSTIFELRAVPGLGPKKIKALYDQLQIASLAELEYACGENRLLELKGFGAKTQANILQGIARIKGNHGKVILPVALQEAEGVREQLEGLPGISRVEFTGELRRHSEVLGSLDFLLTGKPKELAVALAKAGYAEGRDGAWLVKSERGLRVRVWVVEEQAFGTRWLETTGPINFVDKLGKLPAVATEEALFAAKKAPFLPAECRDLGISSPDLLEEKEIRGVFHLHTTWSDGKNSLEEMVAAADALGFEYLGLSDHSQTAFYAHGLDEKRVLQQKKEIEKVQEKYPKVRIFHGIESDILPDGSLDYPPSFLKNFDFVIASVHGQMKMGSAEMTNRLCRALENPATTWLGHWTGRLLLGRDGYAFDVEEVLRTAAREGKSIELNASPYRLDIDWRLLPQLVELGIPIGIHPDAHSAGGLADVRFGVWMARKAGLTAQHVTNTRTRKEMEAWLEERKARC